MLQIASGMYWRPGVPVRETVHRATLYTNAWRLTPDPVELPIATLRFSTGVRPIASVAADVTERMEQPDDQLVGMVSTGGHELIADVAAVLAFTLNLTFSTDVDLVRRLVPDAPPAGPGRAPSNVLRRTFDPRVLLSDDDLNDAAQFLDRLLALQRPDFERALRAIHGIVDATLLLADDPTLAYTLLVASIESLAASTPAPPTHWEAFDASKRKLIDEACAGLTAEQTERVRAAVLTADALGLGRKFRQFTLEHVEPSFFRAEAAGALWPISASALPHTLDFAYQVRSRNVHALLQLAPELQALGLRADTSRVDRRTVLSLEGLTRLCRHVIRRYVERAPTGLDACFDPRSALPGLIRMEVAAQHWIFQANGFSVKQAPAYLNGFLELLLPVLGGVDDAGLVPMGDVLARIEAMLPGESKAAARAPMVALYRLWHHYLVAEQHRPNADRLISRFRADLDAPSAAAFTVALLIDGDVPWPTEQLAAFVSTRAGQLRRGKGDPLPPGLDAALHLCLARRFRQEGRAEQALAAVADAVETIPGHARLLELEEQVTADPVDAAGLDSLDVRGFLINAVAASTDQPAADDAPDDTAIPGSGTSADDATATAPGDAHAATATASDSAACAPARGES